MKKEKKAVKNWRTQLMNGQKEMNNLRELRRVRNSHNQENKVKEKGNRF